jgi:molybdopterin-containing oxidoreductase family iron-sulfur binding subunit
MANPDETGGQASRAYWKSLAEWLDPSRTEDPRGGDTVAPRREVLKLLGASLGLAGVAGCAPTRTEKMVPFVEQPREMTPGIPQQYATSMELDGFGTGLLVKSHDGRPTKIEGHPDHPASLGAAGPYEQAAILGLYDPHRAQASRFRTSPTSFDRIVQRFAASREDGGARLRFLLEPTGSPLVGDLVARIAARFPEARFTFFSPLGTTHAADGGRIAFGVPVQPQYDLSRASTILAVDADFLTAMPFHLRMARDFAERRRTTEPSHPMNRLYVVEPCLTSTGAMADHRIVRKPTEIAALLGAVVAELSLLLSNRVPANVANALVSLRPTRDAAMVSAIARDLGKHPESSLIIVGERQPKEVHALAQFANSVLFAQGAFSVIAPTPIDAGAATTTLADLMHDIADRHVDSLVVVGGNPVYTAPADLDVARRFAQVDDTLYVGLYENETAQASKWFSPTTHFLESWGDARAYDGTISFVQPLIDPLFGGRSPTELLAAMAGDHLLDPREILRGYWTRTHTAGDFDTFWNDALRRGYLPGSGSDRLKPRLAAAEIATAVHDLARTRVESSPSFELDFAADPGVYDGRFANNGWLQEFPRPITKLTWGNAALLGPGTAARLAVENDDVVEVRRQDRVLRAPVLVTPGHAEDALTLHLGYGREGAEALARGIGANAYALRTTDATAFATDVEVRKVKGEKQPLALTQSHFSVDGRPIARTATLDEWRADPDFTAHERGPLPSLFAPNRSDGQQWAMTIDTSICTGCGACVLGCQSENNIFVVGKEQVLRRREMHWLRVDTYFAGPPEEPEVMHEIMLCQHCEKAPCEYVCPVNATVHSPDGLNEMTYNRCVGTRFCSNNCPYKVRRFNWFDWVAHEPANQGLVKLQRNPNVTVRERGVMEKCTYCVQRIRAADIASRNEERTIQTGEVVTACQQACPTQAIQFDSLANTDSRMVKWRGESRVYSVLHELGTVPRTQYLARIKNPNPEIGS